jgi:hypothetical protein
VTEDQPHEHVWDSTYQDTHERCYCGATEPRTAPEDETYGAQTGRPEPTTPPEGVERVTGL